MTNKTPLIVVFLPVRLIASILRASLDSLRRLNTNNINIEYWFYDDNDDQDSSNLIKQFCVDHPNNSRSLPKVEFQRTEYLTNDDTHLWNSELVDRISTIKNYAFSEFLKTDADAIYMLDADTCLHPDTIDYLYGLNLPIVASGHWTRYRKNETYLPNAWDFQTYGHFSAESILKFKNPDVYEVGGVGGCTMYRREPLEKGVSFTRINNLNLWGEDKHMSVRAACLGFPIHIDTRFLAFHIFRESLLPEYYAWQESGCDPSFFDPWLDSEWERDIRNRFLARDQYPFLKRVRIAFRKIMNVLKES